LALVAGEVPSEPGGVGARAIPFGAGQGAEEMVERFAVVAENGAPRDGSVPGGWAKRAGLGGGKGCRADKDVRNGLRENEAVPLNDIREPT